MKIILNRILASLLITSISGLAIAASESVEKVQVLNVMKKYVEATSCWHSFEKDSHFKPTTTKDVYPVYLDKDSGSAEYYVFWAGDKGCQGGSGTISYIMTVVAKYADDKPFLVQYDDAFGKDLGVNFRFVESIKQINKDQFEIISWDYADEIYGGKDNGNNFPANKFKYTVSNLTGQGWSITKKTLLDQNK